MKQNPYIGPRPYERGDRARFYGREREAQELQALIAAEKEVLVYAQSGAGKTSLFNARVIPALEEQGFNVLPVARVGLDLPTGVKPDEVENIFVLNALMALVGAEADPRVLLPMKLVEYLQSQQAAPIAGGDQHTAPADTPDFDFQLDLARPLVLVFDQFEELFTTHRQYWEEEKGFFEQLCAAMQAIPNMGVVFVMREDHLAELDPFLEYFPNRLRTRFRLERLNQRAALAAITRPAEKAEVPFSPGVAEKLVDDLRRVKVQLGSGQEGSALGPFVEPVQLQVVCSQLWINLPDDKIDPIRQEEVDQYGNVNRALIGFYEQAIHGVVTRCAVPERAVRRWFGRQLITAVGTRGLVLEGREETGELPNAAVEILEELHIIRAEVRAGARWYELSHDRLIDSIQKSNREWERLNETPLNAAARQWNETGNSNLLYRGKQLAEASHALEQHPEEFDPEEQKFIEASVKTEQASRRRITIAGSLLAGLLFVVLTFLTVWSLRSAQEASASKKVAEDRRVTAEYTSTLAVAAQRYSMKLYGEAEEQRQETARQITLNRARELALASVNAQNQNHSQLGALLALQSMAVYHTVEQGSFAAGEQVLRDSLGQISGLPLNDHTGLFTAFVVSSDGRWAAMAGQEGGILVRDIADPYQVSAPLLIPSTGPVYSLEFSQDNHFLLWGSEAGRTYLCDWQNSPNTPAILQLPGQARLHDVQISPNNGWMALADEDRNLYLWSLSGGAPAGGPLLLFQAAAAIPVPVFRPGGEWLAVYDADIGRVTFWNLNELQAEKPNILLSQNNSLSTTLAFSPDGLWMVTIDTYTLAVFDLQNGISADLQPINEFLTEFDIREEFTHALAFRADNCFLVAGSTRSARVIWLDREKKPEQVRLFETDSVVGALAMGEDSIIIGGNNNRIRIQAVSLPVQSTSGCEYLPPGDNILKKTDALQYTLSGLESPVRLIRYTQTQKGLVAASKDGDARLWKFKPLELSAYPSWIYVTDEPTFAAKLSPDQRWIAIADLLHLNLGPYQNGPTTPMYQNHFCIFAITFSHNRRWLAAGTSPEDLYLWKLDDLSAEPLDFLAEKYKNLGGSGCGAMNTVGEHAHVEFSQDDRWVVYSEYGDGKSWAWKLDDAGRPLEAINLPYEHFYFSPDGVFAAAITRGDQGKAIVSIFGMQGDHPFSELTQAVASWEYSDTVSIAFDQSGKSLVIYQPSENIRLLDLSALKTGAQVVKTVIGLKDIAFYALDPVGKELFVYNSSGLLQSLDVAKILATSGDSVGAQAVENFHLETGFSIVSVAASLDGNWLAVSNTDSAIRLWNRANLGAAPLLLRGKNEELGALTFTPDSRKLILISGERGAAIWSFQLDDVIRLACEQTSRDLSPEEAQQYLPGEKPLPVCQSPAP